MSLPVQFNSKLGLLLSFGALSLVSLWFLSVDSPAESPEAVVQEQSCSTNCGSDSIFDKLPSAEDLSVIEDAEMGERELAWQDFLAQCGTDEPGAPMLTLMMIQLREEDPLVEEVSLTNLYRVLDHEGREYVIRAERPSRLEAIVEVFEVNTAGEWFPLELPPGFDYRLSGLDPLIAGSEIIYTEAEMIWRLESGAKVLVQMEDSLVSEFAYEGQHRGLNCDFQACSCP